MGPLQNEKLDGCGPSFETQDRRWSGVSVRRVRADKEVTRMIKVLVSGRHNGAEMARNEMFKEGRTPLHTLRADIDYALVPALTKAGLTGIKVWVCRGEVYGKKDLAPNFTSSNNERRMGGNQRRGGFRKKNNNR